MTKEFFDNLNMWVTDDSHTRHVNISLGGADLDYRQKEVVWVYDYNIMAGSFVTSTKELETLDLKAIKKASLLKEMESLNG